MRRNTHTLPAIFVVLAAAAALSGCSTFGVTEKYDRTPAGWHVHWIDHGTISTGRHSRSELYAAFDAAMERSFTEAAAKVNLSRDYVAKTIRHRDALYTLHDDSIFEVASGSADAPNAVDASGETGGRSHTAVAYFLWVSVKNGTAIPAGTAPWTVHPNPNHADETIYGTEPADRLYPALGYELHWQFTLNP